MDLSCIIQSGDLELYALGLLPEDESRKVEELVRLFPEVKAELDAIYTALEKAAAGSAVNPSASCKEKIMSALPEKKESAKVVSMKKADESKQASPGFAVAAAWVLVVLLGALTGYLFYSNSNLNNNITSLNKSVSGYQSKVDELNTKFAALEHYRRMKNDPAGYVDIAMKDTKGGPMAVELFWEKSTRDLYLDISSLPKAPEGKQYQLWFINNGTPVDAGMIELSDSILIQKMKNCPAAQVFAITIEKEGGSPKPTTAPIVAGNPG